MGYLSSDELVALCSEAGFAELGRRLVAEARPAIHLVREAGEDGSIPLGASKLGGWPDLPEGTAWPMGRHRPLAFLGQLSLAEVPRNEATAALPERGLLSVFYNVPDQPWGIEPNDRGEWQVLYWPEPTGLTRTEPPARAYGDHEAEDHAFTACPVKFELVTTFREADGIIAAHEGSEALLERYERAIRGGEGEDAAPHHQLLGHPLVIQNPMEEQCQLVSNAPRFGVELLDEQERAELAKGVEDWMLLLQLETDDVPGWMWGDMGTLYFWIRKQDLAARDFSNVWCILRCG